MYVSCKTRRKIRDAFSYLLVIIQIAGISAGFYAVVMLAAHIQDTWHDTTIICQRVTHTTDPRVCK